MTVREILDGFSADVTALRSEREKPVTVTEREMRVWTDLRLDLLEDTLLRLLGALSK